MKQLHIINKGRLEPEALTLLGASTKRGNKSKIGQFGSGNKYALAYLLKHNFNVMIWAGQDQLRIGTVKKTFRENEFDILTVNDKESSITLDFGYKWTLWQAIRELYSNAVDEGMIYFGTKPPFFEVGSPEDVALHAYDYTRIVIDLTPELEDLIFNLRDYIATKNEVIFECAAGKIYRKHSAKACIYYRGIRCYETGKESIFDYDFPTMEIGEDRLIKHSWELPERIWNLLFNCTDESIIRTVLQEIQNPKFIENDIDGFLVTIPDVKNKEIWKRCLEGSSIAPRDLGGYVNEEDKASTLLLPGKLYNRLIGSIGNGLKSKAFTISKGGTLFHPYIPDPKQTASLSKALDFFRECNYTAPLVHKIKTVTFDNKDVLAAVSEDDEILISERVLEEGVQKIVEGIIEEHIHISRKVKDCTREFQNASITEFINYMKEKNAYII